MTTADSPFGFDEIYNSYGLGNDGRFICNVYGMEETALARMDLREGETDAHALFQKMSAGEGVLVGVHVNRGTCPGAGAGSGGYRPAHHRL